MLVIHREGLAQYEYSIRISDEACHGSYMVNPSAEVHRATGIHVNRGRSILSFADGLLADGREVVMDWRFNGSRPKIFKYRNEGSTVLIYFLFGLAWSKGEWERLLTSIKMYIKPEMRLGVLECTAQFYFEQSPSRLIDKQLNLIVP
ncbi:MAG: hypothetical protein WCT54_01345 [Patescibacteria group bacterium]|jgi:hypothetical protein